VKTPSRTEAIKQARKMSSIHQGLLTGIWYVDETTKPIRVSCANHHQARHHRAKILIDNTLDLMGLTAEITYLGGSWVDYVPKEQS